VTIEADRKAAKQRGFYLKLTPQGGNLMAGLFGGFLSASTDVQEAELADTLKLWFTAQATGAGETVQDAAWWMTQVIDPRRRLSQQETTKKTEEFVSFAVATIGLLVDEGLLAWNKEVEIPTLLTSTSDLLSDEENEMVRRYIGDVHE
jgi:hypothetical protein